MIDISILIPVYNGMPYLEDCLRSIENQKKQSFDINILNDCSTDKTKSLIDSFKKNSSHQVKVFHSKKQRGFYKSLKILIKLSKGAYYLIIGHDDLLSAKCIQSFCESSGFKNNVDIIAGKQIIRDVISSKLSNGFVLKDGLYSRDYFFKNFFKMSLGNLYIGLIKKKFISIKVYKSIEQKKFKKGFLSDHRSLVYSMSNKKNSEFYFCNKSIIYKGVMPKTNNQNEYGTNLNSIQYVYLLIKGFLPLLKEKIYIFIWSKVLISFFLRTGIGFLRKNYKNILINFFMFNVYLSKCVCLILFYIFRNPIK